MKNSSEELEELMRSYCIFFKHVKLLEKLIIASLDDKGLRLVVKWPTGSKTREE